MKHYNILIACGSGVATSTVIANRVKNLCERHGYPVKVNQVTIVEVEKLAAEYDLIVSSAKVMDTVKTPSVFAINYLTGIQPESVDRKILEILSKLDSQEKKGAI